MRTFFYVKYPGQLVANMIASAVVDGTYMDSFEFSSLVDKIVISIGLDKAASDLIETVRLCNRRQGNSRLFVQAMACLLGPVAEEHYNEIVTFGSPLYPVSQTSQFLFDDFYFNLLFFGENNNQQFCCSSLFVPIPKGEKLEERSISAEFSSEPVSEGEIEFDDVRWEGNPDPTAMDDGHPPVINVGDHSDILLKLINSEENTNLIVGYQLLVQDAEGQWNVIANICFFHPSKLRSVKRSDIKVWC